MKKAKEVQEKKQALNKGAFGFIKSKKKAYLIRVACYMAAGILIFVLGLCLNKFNRANIFTILAVLMVLPGAKAMTEFILFARYKTVEEDRYKAVYEALTANLDSVHSLHEVMQTTSVIDQKVTLFTDVVFTSKEKAMNLDFVILTKHALYCLVGKLGQEEAYIQTYLKEVMKEHHAICEVRVTKSEEKFLSLAKKISERGIGEDDLNVKVVQTMQIYIVD